MKLLCMACMGLAALASGCDQEQDPVVAQVGPHSISATRLRAFVEELPEGLRLAEKGDAARRRYLQDLIDGRLLLMEARARGLDTTEAVRAQVEEAIDERVRTLYRIREITAGVEVPEEEVRRYFAAEGFDVERKLNAILVETRAQVEEVLGRLQAGQPFAEVARAYSRDERSAVQGGELGFIGREMALRLNIPLEVFRSLPAGQVSKALNAGRHWHVVRFTEERPVAYEQYRDLIRSRLLEERLARREEEHLEELEKAFGLRLNPEGLKELVRAHGHRTADSLSAGSPVLYTYDQGEIDASRVQQRLGRLNLQGRLADSASAVAVLRRAFVKPFLLKEAARRAGMYDQPEIRGLEQERMEEALLEALRKTAVSQQASVSEEEARQYYDDHPELFRHEETVWVQELLLSTRAEAEEVLKELEAGAGFAELADRSLREEALENEAQFHFHPRERVLYPKLVPAMLEAAAGELVGPLEVEGGYSVFRVLRREEEGVEPFATASRRARALVRRQREEEGLEVLIKSLRSQYASQIRVYESHLRQALPDDLMGG